MEVVATERKEPEGQVHPKSESRIPVEMHARHLGGAVERQLPAQTAGQSGMAVHAGPEVEKVSPDWQRQVPVSVRVAPEPQTLQLEEEEGPEHLRHEE